MIEIKKGKEPYELLSYRKKARANYDNMDCKQTVLESLMREQGYLCAYCMRRIPEERELPFGVKPATIEHWEAQSKTGECGAYSGSAKTRNRKSDFIQEQRDHFFR